jgi:tetratricopeptide (TPR) repeat protein
MKISNFEILKYVTIVLVMVSCDEVLDENPDNRTFIDSPEKIAELLVGAYPEAGYVPFLEPMSDNAGDKGPSATRDFRVNEEMYFWRDLNDTDNDTPSDYWIETYEAISHANQALSSIETLGGGAELNPLRGEALLCRAYAHFMLVNIFSKAYNPETSATDLGIPYVTAPETVLLGDFERSNVAEVYRNIRRDLEEGLPLIEDNYEVPAFHFTKAAANAFASRFYLVLGEWEAVVRHSTLALGTTNMEGKLRNIVASSNLTFQEEFTLYTSSTEEPANLLLVSGNSIYRRMDAVARYQLTPRLTGLLFNDNISGGQWAYSIFSRGGSGNNSVPKYQEYFRVTNQAADIGFAFVTFVLLSTDEVLLNRAEAYAMLGELDAAVNDINLSLQVKTANYEIPDNLLTTDIIADVYRELPIDLYTPFYEIPENALPFVAAVLDIKRTVFYNEGLRWLDIKRHDVAIEHQDFSGNSFVLPKGDNRRAIQIPEAAQALGIVENPR